MNKKERDNLIKELFDQHDNLRKQLDFIYNKVSESKNLDADEIVDKLEKFGKDLAEHVKIENEKLYPGVLADMRVNKENTAMTESVVIEMKNIESEVQSFLDVYDNASTIDYSSSEFEHEFSKIRRTLILRIEMEEAGIFKYWNDK